MDQSPQRNIERRDRLWDRRRPEGSRWAALGQGMLNLFKGSFWKNFLRSTKEELTVVVLSRGHLEVRKLRLTPKALRTLLYMTASLTLVVLFSFGFFFYFLADLPDRALMVAENRALRSELNRVQFHLDTLQTTVDRMSRFDQKLRALIEVDREFAQLRGPKGQGGEAGDEPEIFDLGDYQVEGASVTLEAESEPFLDRRQIFTLQKIYSWMRRLYGSAETQEQSLEELFEVLKGREIQLASTPSILPVNGWVTSHFGYRIDPFTGRRALHQGMDVVARIGAPIMAPAEGVVTFAGKYGSYGNAVMVFHGYGVTTLYAHCNEIYVQSGQRVRRGDVIASVGNTGRSTAPHLHYEVIVHGVPVDPRKYVLNRQSAY